MKTPFLNKHLFLTLLTVVFGCNISKSKKNTNKSYPITPVNIQNIKLTDEFWLPIIKTVQEKTIDYALKKCEEEGRFDNFLIAGGKVEGTVKGQMPFDDSDVYKIIEGASNSLISAPNKQLEQLLDSLVNIIKIGQEKDGYLTTWRSINPANPPADWVKVDKGVRWESLDKSHELYNVGHLYEAAVVHYKATGKRNFLDIALKNADLIVQTFGAEEGKIHTVPGHQIIETGLIKLYEVTQNEAYLNLAKYFLDNRGNHENHNSFGAYAQDHIPVVNQEEVVGHAVRAIYMYSAMTDIAAIQNDTSYQQATDKLWNNMVSKKMYLTGGIGAKHEGEAFGENYELPNLTAYNETCASIGNVYWNHRLHNASGDVKYFDIIERTLYNGLISGLSLDGEKFFYPNALKSDGVYEFNQGACTRKSWFDCSCCPTNIIRFIPSLPSLMYSKTKNTVYVNLYASNEATIVLENNTVHISQQTNYPWEGHVAITLNSEKASEFTVKLRVPNWAKNEVIPSNLYQYIEKSSKNTNISINGKPVAIEEIDGYFSITKTWNKGETITLDFPMEVKKVVSNANVIENKNKIALEYGPLVYAIEEIDNKIDFDAITINSSDVFEIKKDTILGGINTLENNKLKAIPYYAWSNRDVGKMKVWIPKEN
ncbi:glycoside hydrolase family 127 protein [Polaribacter vadi]|uniref:glycoside hydrolase family 127 protein n=1 Tax=Polaribacter vadi TaxID=1774273 RepID=UPI0030EBA56B|tara:strand:+ start:38015 stop:39973 length:1959 start_codon:yes stop_codon:yes gene_type:complete